MTNDIKAQAFPLPCPHEQCRCQVEADSAFRREDALYCSEGCMSGAGCEHEGCGCAG